ncbi:MAG: TonB-dependent receptor [Vicinamibacteria bacterium]
MRRLAYALVAFLCLCLPVAAHAGDVTGSVVDESGAVLPGASVTLSGPGGSRTAATRSDGKYSFSGLGAGTYKVTASLSGFGSATRDGIAVGASGVVEVPAVQLKIATLGETIVVSASKVESTIANAPATMSVITSESLASNPAQNFGDLLRAVPGMNVIQTSARDVNMTSRQGTSTLATSQLVLLDGRSIYLDFFGLVLWDLVPSNPADIKQIEVVRGPASAVWGANALTGVVNIITKTPREAVGTSLNLQVGNFNRDGGSREADGSGTAFGGGFAIARAPSEKLSFRLSGGYFDSDPYSRPVGQVPVIPDPRLSSPICVVTNVGGVQRGTGPNCIGGAFYPNDVSGSAGAFENSGTKQPKVDLRVDQEIGSGRLSYNAGYAGTEGIVHTGIGPFDLQSGSYMAYGKLGYSRGALKITGFANFLDAEAPNLLLTDPATLRPVALNFKTKTFDFEVGHSTVVGGNHILSYGGNARRNNFEITLTPAVEDRNEFGAYLQDEFHYGKFRLSLGGRVDKFGNIDDAVFSPRATVMFKPTPDHSIRVSFNRAFRSPSAVNNYLDQSIFAPTAIDMRALVPLAPPALRPALSAPWNLIVRNVGNRVGSSSGTTTLKEESLDAYEISYTGTFKNRTTFGLALYQNDSDDNINFASVLPSASFPTGIVPPFDLYNTTNAPAVIGLNQAGVPVPGPLLMAFLAQVNQILPPAARIALPRTVSTYLNLGPLRQRGVEVSLDHRFDSRFSASANYSWQDRPEALDPASGQIPYLNEELALPAEHRFNAAFSWNTTRLVGQASANYTSEALWTDVLTSQYHGFTDGYTMVNATFGVKWADGKVTTSIKGTNIFNEEIQQHVFGDILRRSIFAEVRLQF